MVCHNNRCSDFTMLPTRTLLILVLLLEALHYGCSELATSETLHQQHGKNIFDRRHGSDNSATSTALPTQATTGLMVETIDNEAIRMDAVRNTSDIVTEQRRHLDKEIKSNRGQRKRQVKEKISSKKSMNENDNSKGQHGPSDRKMGRSSSSLDSKSGISNSSAEYRYMSAKTRSSGGKASNKDKEDIKPKSDTDATKDTPPVDDIERLFASMMMSMQGTEPPARSPTIMPSNSAPMSLEREPPTHAPTKQQTSSPTLAPVESPKASPTVTPMGSTTAPPTRAPIDISTSSPITTPTTTSPATKAPTRAPATNSPTGSPPKSSPTNSPISGKPTASPITSAPIPPPRTAQPTASPDTGAPTMPPVTGKPSNSPIDATEAPTQTMFCDPPITLTQRRIMLFALLNDITPGAVILIPGTSQNLAFSWLVNDDEAQVCPENELDVIQRYVMAVAYYSLGGNNWNICNAQSSPAVASCLVGKRHLSGATVCEWFNVTCADDANVNSVVLENNNLIGSLPSEFKALEQLVTIGFNSNTAISGSIPTSYGSIAPLRDLDLNSNGLMGVLPGALCSATQLERIDVISNGLEGTIPSCIGALRSLNTFALDRNMFSGTLPTEVGLMSALEFLTVNNNAFTGPIPSELGSNSNLKVLSIQQNGFTGGIPTVLGTLTGLETLNFFSNTLVGPVPSELGNLLKLDNLFLHFNDLTGTMPEAICALRADRGVGMIMQLTADCGPRGKIVCPRDCCTACF